MKEFSQIVTSDGTRFGVVKNTMTCGCVDIRTFRYVSETFLDGEEWTEFQRTLEYRANKREKSFNHRCSGVIA